MTTSATKKRWGIARFLGHLPRGFGLTLVVSLLTVMVLAGAPLEHSKAVKDGEAARVPAAQVRILENGRFVGGGTLVARNWVLTNAHLFSQTNDVRYSLRFGVVNDAADGSDSTNLREIDRTVWHPRADLAMVHFAEPVPENTWIPGLAENAAEDFQWAMPFGWGESRGRVLETLDSVILRAAAAEVVARMRQVKPLFANDFGGVPPLVMNHVPHSGDSGSGVFATNGTLLAVHMGATGFFFVDDAGNPTGDPRNTASYELPVWEFRDWIQSVINGEGTSGQGEDTSGQPPTGQPRRNLAEEPEESTGDLPMTQPPRTDACEPGETGCTLPGPRWARSTLMGSGNYRGTALAVCAQAAGNTCSFNGTTYPGGAIGRLSLGPTKAPGTGPRQAMVWCKTSAVFTEGTPARDALRVSFTNADPSEVPVGMGWWDVTPDQVGTGNTPVDPNQFATC